MPWDRTKGLRARWCRREKDIVYEFPDRSDGRLVNFAFTHEPKDVITGERMKGFLDELEARGYDLTTLRFSIKKKV